VSAKYVLEQFAPSLVPQKQRDLPPLGEYQDRDYGVAFEVPLVVAEALSGLHDRKDVLELRHLLTFLLAIAGVFAVHRLASRRFGDWRIGLLTALLLVLSPRVFAESFYNSKDGAFMAAFAIAMAATVSFVLKPGVRTALLSAIASAFAIDIRIVAVMLPLASTALLAVRLAKHEVPTGPTFRALGLYWPLLVMFVIGMWPWLWFDPVGHFIEAFRNMSSFRWADNVFYFGEYLRPTRLPWHYTIVWISITTPLLYVALFVVGCAAIVWQVVRSNVALWRNDEELQDVMFLGLFAAPLLAVVAMGSVIYDGWRQLYFVYPAYLLVAMKGWVLLWRLQTPRDVHRLVLGAVTLVSIVAVAAWMWRVHPFQNVYFNRLAGTDLRNRFELDYWGLANRRALEEILRRDKRPLISVTNDGVSSVFQAISMLPAEERHRIRYVEDGSEDYIITNWRFTNPAMLTDRTPARYELDYDHVFDFDVDGEIILSVFRRKGR
jgi:hypothetical protein